jgi:hypothetical protein
MTRRRTESYNSCGAQAVRPLFLRALKIKTIRHGI